MSQTAALHLSRPQSRPGGGSECQGSLEPGIRSEFPSSLGNTGAAGEPHRDLTAEGHPALDGTDDEQLSWQPLSLTSSSS